MSETDHPKPLNRTWWHALMMGILVVTVTLPWLRNHQYLRDFMDYGLVMAATARMDAGELPYRDFVTPIQAGFLKINHWAEHLGGGNYLGLTYGGLALIIVAMLSMTWILSRRLPMAWALVFSSAITAASASQHNIIWHNNLGVLCLAIAIWATASAPKWHRSQIGWHLALGLALWIGGVNKISFHLLALAGVAGFILRQLFIGKSNGKACFGLLGFAAISGVAFPIATELWITHVNLSTWYGNVLGLAGASRAQYLDSLLTWEAYLRPLNDHYGALPVPQFGLWFVVSLVGLAAILMRGRSNFDRVMLSIAAAGCAIAANALLVTNHEIAYVAGAGCIVLGVGLLLGFSEGRRFPHAATIWLSVFAIINGLPAWKSAWAGERSLFGHSQAAREDYVELAMMDPRFDYIRGVRIPPEMADSYLGIDNFMPPANAHGQHPAFYATGVEWLEQIWPSLKVKGLPLWMHDGTTYQREQGELLYQLIMPPSRFEILVASVPWDHWPGQSHVSTALFSEPHNSGSVLRVYETQASLHEDNDQIRLINLFGTNFETRLLRFDNTVFQLSEAGQIYFGTYNEEPATVYLDWKGSRALAKGILRRLDGADDSTLGAEFVIEYEVDGDWHHIETARLELGADETEKTFELKFDGRLRELRFRVVVDQGDPAIVSAGWFAPTLMHSQAVDGPPPPLMRRASEVSPITSDRLAAFNRTEWTPDEVFLRGGRVTEEGYLLEPGGQIWMKAVHPLRALDGQISVSSKAPPNAVMPLVRVLWYKGGRVQIAWQDRLNPDSRSHRFHAWSAGPDGWIGILMDPLPGVAPVIVRIDHFDPVP
jgi:hypothetical protein